MDFKKLKISDCKMVDKKWDFFFSEEEVKTSLLSVNPIIVEPEGNKYVLLYGFKIVEAFQERDKETIPAYILNKLPLVEKIKKIAEYHRQKRSLYPIEIAKIIDKIEDKVKKEKLATEIADALGINRGYQIIDEYKSLNEVPEYIARFLTKKDASLKLIRQFRNRDESVLKKILDKCEPTLNEFMNISKNLYEIAQREDKNIFEIVEELELDRILSKQGKQAVGKIYSLLEKRRYPIKNEYETKLRNELKKIDSPSFIKINPDWSLETRNLKFEAKISEERELDQLIDFFKGVDKQPLIKILSEI